MRACQCLFALSVAVVFSLAGCGSKEPTVMDGSELQQYVDENAAALEEEDRLQDLEDEAEDAAGDD